LFIFCSSRYYAKQNVMIATLATITLGLVELVI